jgi:hypothetical protein
MPGMKIVTILYDPAGLDITNEWILLENSASGAVTLTGFTLQDALGHAYTFPGFSLAGGAQVRVWTKSGIDTAGDLFWGRNAPVWNNDPGDIAILHNAQGAEVARYRYRNAAANPRSRGLGGGGALYGPVISPYAPSTMWASCDMGGLYRSIDAGLTWDMLDTRAVKGATRFTVAYDPTRSAHLVGLHPVQGLQESFDDGLGWSPFTPPLPAGTIVTAAGFSPDAPAVLLVGATNGLYRFDAAAGAWTQVASVPGEVVGFALPGAGMPYFVATLDDVFQSNDQGQSWTPIGAGLPARPPGPWEPTVSANDSAYLVSRIRGFAGGAAGGRYVVYATVATVPADVQTQPGGTKLLTAGGVYRLDSAVGTWERATPNVDVTAGDQGGGTPIPRFERLAVSATAPDTVYVSVQNTTYDPLVLRGVFSGGQWTWTGVYRWTSAPVNVTFGWFEAAQPIPRYGFGLGGAARGLVAAPTNPDVVAMANNAAVYVTGDGGTSWTQAFTKAAGSRWQTNGVDVTSTWFYRIHPTQPAIHFICSTDIGLARSVDAGSSWESIVFADIGRPNVHRWANFYALAFERPGNRIWAAVSTQHDIPRQTQLAVPNARLGEGAVLASDDDGASWFRVNQTPLPGPVVSVLWSAPTLYASVWGSGVHESGDRGTTWTSLGAFPAGASTRCYRLQMVGSTLHCIVSADRSAGFVAGDLYELSGSQWTPVAVAGKPTLAQAAAPARPAPVDFTRGNLVTAELYVCLQSVPGSNGGGGVYQFDRTDGWQKCPVPFPPEYGSTVEAFAPYTVWRPVPWRARIYATSSHGIWYTDDAEQPPAQQHWTELPVIPFLSAQRLEFDFQGAITHVTTFGGGAWPVTRGRLPFAAG